MDNIFNIDNIFKISDIFKIDNIFKIDDIFGMVKTCWWSRPITAFSSVWVCRSRTWWKKMIGEKWTEKFLQRSNRAVVHFFAITRHHLQSSYFTKTFGELKKGLSLPVTSLVSICATQLWRALQRVQVDGGKSPICSSFPSFWSYYSASL